MHFLDLSYEQTKELIVSLGEPAYRTDQVLKWIYQKLASSFEEMSDLPQTLRQKLITQSQLSTFTLLEQRVSRDKATRKMLFQLLDGRTIESTLMLYGQTASSRERRTVCVSTQVGCPVGCLFCATGQQGFERNLLAGEILEQVLFSMQMLKKEISAAEIELSRGLITNVVFMGMGEPLANYENVWQAVVILNSKQGLGLGTRQITLSTAGLVPQILRLAGESLHVELAISLHAPHNRLRDRLMPINQKYPLEQLIPVCREYLERTGRRPTFEYALFQDINDSLENARELSHLLKGLNCSVNLIAGNPTSCQEYRSSSRRQALAFQKQLTTSGISSTIRVSRGMDIDAGCGQLRSRWLKP